MHKHYLLPGGLSIRFLTPGLTLAGWFLAGWFLDDGNPVQ
jgi:hypothetical protein